jgi:hypothetical protein
MAPAHIDDRIRYEVELHTGKLELKAKVGFIEVQQRLVKPACPDMQGPFDTECPSARVWKIRRVREFLETISLWMCAAGSYPRGIELFDINATGNEVMPRERFPHGCYPSRGHLIIGVTEGYSLASSSLHTNITGEW